MALVDWTIITVFIVLSLVAGLWVSRRASQDVSSYFLGGGKFPWWAIGFSMVATTFAADTPLAVTEYIRALGIWRNWFWWCLAIGHVLAAILFAPLWKRSGMLTDNQLIELRYGGRPAALLRAIKALYFSVFFNILVMAWVIAAMSTSIEHFLGVNSKVAVVVCLAVALVYSTASGFWGVVVTDVIQFVFAMTGTIIFAFFAVAQVGGMDALLEKLQSGGLLEHATVFPQGGFHNWADLAVFLGIMWWANHNADGGGYIIQRMLSAKSEKESERGTLFFTFFHYVVRFWPWALVALVSLVLIPEVPGKDAYPKLLAQILPAGWRGLYVAVFLAAFMSTIDTHLNWGASYLVNDLYRRFINTAASEKRCLLVGRLATVLLLLAAGLSSFFIERISGAWELVWALGAGLGPVLILRWLWWRISAWSEIAAMAGSLFLAVAIEVAGKIFGFSPELYQKALLIVPFSAIIWLTVTWLMPAESSEVLEIFMDRVCPPGRWPRRHPWPKGMLWRWAGGVLFIYGMLFAVGSFILRKYETSALLFATAVLGAIMFIYKSQAQPSPGKTD